MFEGDLVSETFELFPQSSFYPLILRSYMYYYRDFHISDAMLEDIRDYLEKAFIPSGFLASVICNDLSGSVLKADDETLRNLPAFSAYFVNETPGTCWGSYEKMQKWLNKNQQSRDEDIAVSRRSKQISEDDYIFHKLHRTS